MQVSHPEQCCNRTPSNLSDNAKLKCIARDAGERSNKVSHQYNVELIMFCSVPGMSCRSSVIISSSSLTSIACSGAFLQ